MIIKDVLRELDSLDYTQVEDFLVNKMKEADEDNDVNSKITLLNEVIGHFRETGDFMKTRKYSDELLTILDKEHLQGTIPYATSLLNIANADRASGDYEESLDYFYMAYALYEKLLKEDDFMFASINNNLALLYQEMTNYNKACECLKKSLAIVELHPEKRIERAITLSNLAQSELRCEKYEDAKEHIDMAMSIFNADEVKDYHYSGALAVYAELMYIKERYAEAAKYYDEAMDEMEKNIGRTNNYDILVENKEKSIMKAKEFGQTEVELVDDNQENLKGLELCRKYYEEVGAPMIHEQFPKYESRIAVGLVGEGSDCFGFDDDASRDHDWGPGFCMWVDDVTYEAIGIQLQAAYDRLPSEYMGYRRRTTREAEGRVGVIRVREFYSNLLKLQNGIPRSEEEWMAVDENDLAAATNGAIFRDDDGIFFGLRNQLLAYYPESVFRRKLAYELVRMAQTGQYNFSRCLRRDDKVTASMYLSEYTEHALKVLFLLNRKYAPYKKWLMAAAAKKLNILPEVTDIIIAIYDMDIFDENVQSSIEIIAKLILNELKKQNLIIEFNRQDPYFLEPYGHEIMGSIQYISDNNVKDVNPVTSKHNELVDKMVLAEWNAFDKVKNEGGRADCQDDWNTFSIMRKSQYMTWNNDMLESYLNDFMEADAKGWNLITEKYARMEASTAPEEYAKIKDSLPAVDDKKKAIVEEIVKIQVGFMEELEDDYPNVVRNARSIHTYEDSAHNTSYETYLRGELLTYSEETLSLYGKYVVEYAKNEKNLAFDIITNTAHLYGYKSLDELEEVMTK